MDFQQKSRLVAGGHRTEARNGIIYSSMVSHDSIHIGFLLEYLYGVNITAIYMDNAYLNALCAE